MSWRGWTDANHLSRALGRRIGLDLIRIDEQGYAPPAETTCELAARPGDGF
jgi:hypothetical protein